MFVIVLETAGADWYWNEESQNWWRQTNMATEYESLDDAKAEKPYAIEYGSTGKVCIRERV